MRACIGRCGLATLTNGKHPLPSTRNDPHLTTAGSSVACRRPHRRSSDTLLQTVLLLVMTSRSAVAPRPVEASIMATNIAQLVRGDDALQGRQKPTHSVSSIIHVPSVTFMKLYVGSLSPYWLHFKISSTRFVSSAGSLTGKVVRAHRFPVNAIDKLQGRRPRRGPEPLLGPRRPGHPPDGLLAGGSTSAQAVRDALPPSLPQQPPPSRAAASLRCDPERSRRRDAG